MIDDLFASLNYISVLSWDAKVRLFWFFLLFDFPRYVLTDIYIFFVEMYKRFLAPRAREMAFAGRLASDPPLVSVIVPALNEERTIAWTVLSLKEQTYKNLEIIVVDDGSTDDTPRICRRLAGQGGIHYHRFEQRAGKSAALNYGLQFAKGEYVIFVDSDASFDRDAVFELIMAFADPQVGAVSGNLLARNRTRNILTAVQYIDYLFSISIGRRIRAHFGTLPVISGAFGGFRRDIIAIDRIGGHEPGPGNDSDLTIRVRKLGYKIAFAPKALCLTEVPESLPAFIRQRWRWDRNIIKNRVRKHKSVFNPFNANFRTADAISFFDTIFFHVLLGAFTVVYLIDIYFNYRDMLVFILLHYCPVNFRTNSTGFQHELLH